MPPQAGGRYAKASPQVRQVMEVGLVLMLLDILWWLRKEY